MRRVVYAMVVIGVLLAAAIVVAWPRLYVLGGGQTAPGLERITGIARVPPGYIVPGTLALRWYRFVFGDASTDSSVNAAYQRKRVGGMWSIEYLPDGTVFEIMRNGNLHGFFSQDAATLLDRTYLAGANDDEEDQAHFAFDPQNRGFRVLRRGKMTLSGQDTAWALVDLVRADRSHASGFVSETTVPARDELVIIYGLTKGPRFNMAAARRLFAMMKF